MKVQRKLCFQNIQILPNKVKHSLMFRQMLYKLVEAAKFSNIKKKYLRKRRKKAEFERKTFPRERGRSKINVGCPFWK